MQAYSKQNKPSQMRAFYNKRGKGQSVMFKNLHRHGKKQRRQLLKLDLINRLEEYGKEEKEKRGVPISRR